MKRWVLLALLFLLVGLGVAQQAPPSNNAYIYPRPMLAQKPDGSWTYLEVDGTGGLVGAGAGFPIIGQPAPDNSAYLYPTPLIAQDAQGNWHYLLVDNTGALKTTGGGGSVTPGGSPDAIQYNIANSSLGGLNSPTTNGNCIVSFNVNAGAAVVPTCSIPGVTVNAQSGNYSIQYTDRAAYLKVSGGTTSLINLCQIAATCANNFPLVLQNLNTENMTITANAADSVDGGSTGGSITVGPNQAAFVYQDSTSAPGHWWSLIVPTTSGTATTSLYFILNSTATGTSIGAPTLNATKLWSFICNVTVIHATKIVYAVNTQDASGVNLYNLALFDTQGNIVAQTGALLGSAFSATTGQKSVSSTAPFNVYAGVRYYVGITGTATTALLGGANNHFDALCGAAATSNNATTNAVWTTPIGIPADSVNLQCVEPTFGFYQ